MKFYDMFGGIGGFRLGLENASDKYECVGYCDNDKFAVKSYNAIFGENHESKDATKLRPEELPDFDILCGGFPCQSFSIAGHRKGTKDPRGKLFREIARIAEAKQPEMLFLENVKGLLSQKAVDEQGEPVEGTKGHAFQEILETLHELGYFIEWKVLNSKHFGVPQNRERVFIIGHLGGEPRRKVFPLGGEDGGDSKQDERVTSKGYDSLKKVNRTASRYKGKQAGGVYDKKGLAPMVNYGKRSPMPHHILERGLLNHENKLTFKDESNAIDENYWKGVEVGSEGSMFTVDGTSIHGVAYQPIDDYNQNFTDVFGAVRQTNASKAPRNGVKLKQGARIRKLTPKECWRLQGFPDWAFEKAREVNSDTQLYKQAGNAVTVNVIEAIGKNFEVIFD